MQRDVFKLRKWLQKSSRGQLNSEQVAKMNQLLDASLAIASSRREALPTPVLDSELPIAQRRDEIIEAISNNQVVIISGETGSGKSTQLPLIALQMGVGVRGLIGHTQPRRIAARSVAARIASQLNTKLGDKVGFKIRFDDTTSDLTFVKLMTDGILLAESQSDRFFDAYELLIIDEAHERSLNIDFLLGSLKRILNKRKDLKIVITSATIDTQRFAEHFSDGKQVPPILHIEGRTYPVEIRYRPPATHETNKDSVMDHLVDSVCQAINEEDGDVLVFLATEADIKNAHKKLRFLQNSNPPIDVLPLYARLSAEQQNAIFQAGNRRRIVLATNVAESSVTVPGIKIVVDSGTARISRYAAKNKVQRLPIEAISQASANQRAGRCGRIAPGICIRLFDEDDFVSRSEFTTPEIRRTNLASVILQTLALRLGHISEFPFIDPPHPEAIADGFRTLFEIGAIDEHKCLTELGRRLSRIPVDPRIGRMLFTGADENCLAEILIIASALEVQDPRIRPAEKQQQADAQHEKFRHEKSDFVSYLKIWDFFQNLRSDLSRSQFRKACQQNFLSINHIHQWQETHRQLKQTIRQAGLKTSQRKDDYNAIHRCLLSGLLSGVAYLTDRNEYTGPGGLKFNLWPGSGVFSNKPKWIVAAELVETSRRYGRTVAKIAPEWLEPMASHLTKHNFVDPHWSSKRQTVMAYENVTLFGLPIVNRRRVGFVKHDREFSRSLFIESALVNQEIKGQFGFLDHNRKVLADLESIAAKSRKTEFVVDENELFDFYNRQLPDECADTASLRRELKRNENVNDQLKFQKSDLNIETEFSSADAFPDNVQIGSMNIPVEYRYEPGSSADGATICIPRDSLPQIDDVQTGWMIPGLHEAQITAMIKSLPKSLRRNLVPAPEKAKLVMAALETRKGTFESVVAKELSRIAGESILPNAFDSKKVSENLKVNIRIVDDLGKTIGQGRDLKSLKKEFQNPASESPDLEDSLWHQDGLTQWDWDAIPDFVEIDRGVAIVTMYPAIVPQQNSVGLRLMNSKSKAKQSTALGLIELFSIVQRKSLKRQVNWLPDFDNHALKLSSIIESNNLKTDLPKTIARLAIDKDINKCRDRMAFDSLIDNAVERISVATQNIAKWLPKVSLAVHSAQLSIESAAADRQSFNASIQTQIQELTKQNFLIETPWKWLQHFPRYFEGITKRCEKLKATGSDRDREVDEIIQRYFEIYVSHKTENESLGIIDPELDQFRWMIEEFRISLFAQQLGTSITVSEKRLDKQISKLSAI